MFFVVNLLGNISHWIIVCFSVNRFIAVNYPLKSIQWLTTRKTKICILLVFVITFAKNLHYLWTTDFFYNTDTGSAICAFGLRNKASWVSVYQAFEVTVSSFLPFLVIAFCNVMIVKKMKNRVGCSEQLAETKLESFPTKTVQSDQQPDTITKSDQYPNPAKVNMNSDQHTDSKSNNDQHSAQIGYKSGGISRKNTQQNDQNITKILLLASTVFIVTTCPLLVFRLYFAKKDISKSDAHTQALYTLGHHICHKLWYTNNGINFFLYCWFSKTFREDLKKMFFKPKTNERTTGITSTVIINTSSH